VRRHRGQLAWRAAVAAIAAALAACSALVDTDGLTGGVRADASSDEAVDVVPETSTGDGPTQDATPEDPCLDQTLPFCERFDTAAALLRFGSDTDPPDTRIEVDTSAFVSAPGSAKFEIDPTMNGSPDATLGFSTSATLARLAFEAWVRIERSEPGERGRLLSMNVASQGNVIIERSGAFSLDGAPLGTIAEPAADQWFRLRVEIRTDVVPAELIVTRGDARSAVVRLADTAWTPGKVSAQFGISEASSPNVGWLVRWDDVRVLKL
jgi:hypothetical protein